MSHSPVPVVPVDLTSEYPSVDALLGIWDVLTAARLTTKDATEEVRKLLASVTLDDLFRPAFWKQFNFYARIVPEGEVLPVRSVYDSKSGTCNIGLNALHWKQPMWVAGPDLIASVVLSGRIPNVQEAFRIVPHGKQRGLKPVELRGAISVDPRREDFFTRAIEYRKQNKADDRLQYFLKILADSTSYGTYLELNPVKIDENKRPKITVYSGEHIFKQPAPDTIEFPGDRSNRLRAASILFLRTTAESCRIFCGSLMRTTTRMALNASCSVCRLQLSATLSTQPNADVHIAAIASVSQLLTRKPTV